MNGPHHNPNWSAKDWDAAATGPLTGLRVLDLSRLVAGNMLTLQLADFGADVIKIEPPEGDPLRAWQENGKPLFWKSYGRNKRSMMLNLRRDADRAAFWALLRTADVMVENYRPGTLEKMGLAPDILQAENPSLVLVRISGFGQTGPYRALPGFGTLVEAMSGFAHQTGFADREPVLPPLALADMIAGLHGAFATVTALMARGADGAGQVIDLSLLEPIYGTLGPSAAILAEQGTVRDRIGSASHTASPRNVYLCRDGHYVALSGSTPAAARRIFAAIGRAEMNDDPRFATNADRIAHRSEVDAAVGAWFMRHDRDDAIAAMRAAGATVGPVNSAADIAADPHFAEREIIVTVPDADLGPMPTHNITPRLSRTPGTFRRPAPDLGADTADILGELGLSPVAIAAILEDG